MGNNLSDGPLAESALPRVSIAINMELLTERQAARASTAEQTDAEDALDQIIDRVGGHIESASGGDEAKIIAAGVGHRVLIACPRCEKETRFPIRFRLR